MNQLDHANDQAGDGLWQGGFDKFSHRLSGSVPEPVEGVEGAEAAEGSTTQCPLYYFQAITRAFLLR